MNRTILEQLAHDAPILLVLLVIVILSIVLLLEDRKNRRRPVKPLVLCAWCPDKEEREKRAIRANPDRPITHGICLSCKRKLLK